MTVPYPDVFRITNYGVDISRSVDGGSGSLMYAVLGLTPEELVTAENYGLPKLNFQHIDPRLGFMGFVKKQTVIQECGPQAYVVRVTFSQNGTFLFTLRIGSRYEAGFDTIRLPVMGNSGSAYFSVLPETSWRRARWTRTESVRYIGNVDAAIDLLSRNLGLYYAKRSGNWINTGLRGTPTRPVDVWRLTGADISTDAGNNTRIDTYFSVMAGMPAFPAGTFAGQTVPIPLLPPDGEYSENTDAPSLVDKIKAVDPLQLLPEAEALPWLP